MHLGGFYVLSNLLLPSQGVGIQDKGLVYYVFELVLASNLAQLSYALVSFSSGFL
jgi:hypothetical protein